MGRQEAVILPGGVCDRQSGVIRGLTLAIGAFLHRRRNWQAPEEVANEVIFADVGAEGVNTGCMGRMG